MTPIKKQGVQVVGLQGMDEFLFLESLLQLKSGWFANHAQPHE
jgi:hypothetical protein